MISAVPFDVTQRRCISAICINASEFLSVRDLSSNSDWRPNCYNLAELSMRPVPGQFDGDTNHLIAIAPTAVGLHTLSDGATWRLRVHVSADHPLIAGVPAESSGLRNLWPPCAGPL